MAKVPWQRCRVERWSWLCDAKVRVRLRECRHEELCKCGEGLGVSSCGQLFNSLKWRERRHNEMAEVPRKCGCVVEWQPWDHDC